MINHDVTFNVLCSGRITDWLNCIDPRPSTNRIVSSEAATFKLPNSTFMPVFHPLQWRACYIIQVAEARPPKVLITQLKFFLVVYALMHSVWKIHSNNGIRHLLLLSVTVSKMWKIIDAQTHQHLERKSEHNSMELYYNKKWWQIFTEMTNKVQNKN